MRNDAQTIRNLTQERQVSKLRNQSQKIPLTRVSKSVLQTNISAAC